MTKVEICIQCDEEFILPCASPYYGICESCYWAHSTPCFGTSVCELGLCECCSKLSHKDIYCPHCDFCGDWGCCGGDE